MKLNSKAKSRLNSILAVALLLTAFQSVVATSPRITAPESQVFDHNSHASQAYIG